MIKTRGGPAIHADRRKREVLRCAQHEQDPIILVVPAEREVASLPIPPREARGGAPVGSQ